MIVNIGTLSSFSTTCCFVRGVYTISASSACFFRASATLASISLRFAAFASSSAAAGGIVWWWELFGSPGSQLCQIILQKKN